jgi:hypothetical protein
MTPTPKPPTRQERLLAIVIGSGMIAGAFILVPLPAGVAAGVLVFLVAALAMAILLTG